MRRLFFPLAFIATILLAPPSFADQLIQQNLVVDGSITAKDGIRAANNSTVSARNFATCGGAPELAADGNNSTPATTSVYVAEVFVPVTVTVTGVANFNGSDATDDIRVGLYSAAGALLATSASTQMVGTDAYQRVPFTAALTVYGPAIYYIAAAFDGTTSRFNTFAVGNCGAGQITGQVYANGFPTTISPPTTFTTALGPIASLY